MLRRIRRIDFPLEPRRPVNLRLAIYASINLPQGSPCRLILEPVKRGYFNSQCLVRSRCTVNEAKIRHMADTIQTMMGMTQKPEQIADELLGIVARTKEWTPEELAELRNRVLPNTGQQ